MSKKKPNTHLRRVEDALMDLAEHMDAAEIQRLTGLPDARCAEIVTIKNSIVVKRMVE
jgi:hypothetical protein